VKGIRIKEGSQNSSSDSENAIKLPGEDDSVRSYSEESSGSYGDIDVD